MGEAKHTPGPWWVGSVSEGGNIRSNRGPVAMTLWFGNSHPEAMRDYANAHLIAAAPDLHEALEQSQAILSKLLPNWSRETKVQIERNAEALAKARGAA